jgi:hypothetical protein
LLGWVETTKGKLASFGTGRIMGCVKCVLGICSVFFLNFKGCKWDCSLLQLRHALRRSVIVGQKTVSLNSSLLSIKVVNLLAGDQYA